MSPPDKIAELKTKYARLIDRKNEEINELENKLRLLAEIEDDIGEKVKPEIASSSKTARYANFGLSDATLDALIMLSKHRTENITKKIVGECMLANGFEPKGKNFMISVAIALNRLAEAGKIETTLNDGKRIYFMK